MAVFLPRFACSADSCLCIHMNKYSRTIILLMHFPRTGSEALRKLDRMKITHLRDGRHLVCVWACVVIMRSREEPLCGLRL